MATWGNQDTLASQPIFVSRESHFDSTAVNTTAHTINLLTANTDFATGTAVHYSINGGTVIGGLTDGTTYYVNRVDANNIALYDTQAHAIAGGATGLLSISGAGVGTHILKLDGTIANPGYDHNYNGRSMFLETTEEAQSFENRAIGLKTPGWVTYTTYTAADGSVRHKSEVLVAMGSEVTESSANYVKTNDPLVSGEITITAQPTNITGAADPYTGTFTLTAAITGSGTIGYQWQVSTDGGTTFTNISNTGVYTGATTATLTLTSASKSGNNNHKFRCVLSATDYTTVTSSVVSIAYA
jgi:hypothetical protein